MNSNERYYYELAVQEELQKLIQKVRIKCAIEESNRKELDKLIECEIEEWME